MTNSLPLHTTSDDTLLVPSRLFGPLRISSDQVIVFPDGLLGFSGTHRFVLLPAASDGVFWLHSIEEGNLAFLVVEPSHFFRDYVVDVPDHEVPFDISVASDLLVLTIVTLPRDPSSRPTANLRAPLVLNYAHRCGCQVLLKDSAYAPRQPFNLPEAPDHDSDSSAKRMR